MHGSLRTILKALPGSTPTWRPIWPLSAALMHPLDLNGKACSRNRPGFVTDLNGERAAVSGSQHVAGDGAQGVRRLVLRSLYVRQNRALFVR